MNGEVLQRLVLEGLQQAVFIQWEQYTRPTRHQERKQSRFLLEHQDDPGRLQA